VDGARQQGIRTRACRHCLLAKSSELARSGHLGERFRARPQMLPAAQPTAFIAVSRRSAYDDPLLHQLRDDGFRSTRAAAASGPRDLLTFGPEAARLVYLMVRYAEPNAEGLRIVPAVALWRRR
jgi:hypothetical protein